jgi:hypothetical protein
VLRRSLCTRVPPSLPRRNDRLHPPLASPAIPAFPWFLSGSASALNFSGPAQRSLLVAARVFAKSPSDPLHRRLQPSCYLHDCSDCYRLERQLPGGTTPTGRSRLFTAHRKCFLVRPDGFEPPTTWFEEAYSKQRKYLENKAFWQIGCATKPPIAHPHSRTRKSP